MSFITLIIAMIIELTMTSFIASTDVSYNGDGKGEYPTNLAQVEPNRGETEEGSRLRAENIAQVETQAKAMEQTLAEGERTWIGRIAGEVDDSDGSLPTIPFEIVKVENGAETVVYSTIVYTYSSTTISVQDDSVVISDYQGAPEGGHFTDIFFVNGEERYRVEYGGAWGYVRSLTVKKESTPQFDILLASSEQCVHRTLYDSSETPDQTEVTGLILVEFQYNEFYPIPKGPIAVPCEFIDSVQYNPTFRVESITPIVNGIAITLPGGRKAFVEIADDGTADVIYPNF